MKTLLLTISIFFTGLLMAQDCSDLIISEVIEGWSNNKAIEIYNPTSEAIDASEYGLVRFQNGSTTPGNITYLVGAVIEAYDVYVVVIDKTDPDGVDFEAPVWDELQLQADVFVNPLYNNGEEVMYFNGNDALALLKDEGATLVDVFGKIGDSLNPDGWGGYTDSQGEQAYVSANHTLVRKPDVLAGYTANPSSFDILNEYDSLPANTFTQLGFHTCNCNADNVEEVTNSQFKVYPNPSDDGVTFLASDIKIETVSIYNLTGVLVENISISPSSTQMIDLSAYASGSYLITVRLESGEEKSELFIR